MWRTVLLFLVTVSCTKHADDSTHGDRFAVQVFISEYGGYGYDILKGSRLLVHQPSVPAISGVQGFATSKSARSVANLVVGKLQLGVMPPTLTVAEVTEAMKYNESQASPY